MANEKTKKILQAVIVTAFAVLWMNEPVQAKSVLQWTGCGITKKAFMAEVTKAYEKETGVVIKLSGGGATKGIRMTNLGHANMGGSCRIALPEKYPEEEGKVFLTVVGWDALVPIVNKINPVNSITSEQLKKIVTGKITNWSEVGGPDNKIQVIARKGKISGVGFMARQILFNDPEAEYTNDAMIVKSSGPLEIRVEKYNWVFGITGISSAKKRNVKILAVDGKKATRENIASGEYPTFRPLYIVTNGKPTGEEKKFLDWLTSEKGQLLVKKAGTVTLKEGAGLKKKFNHWLHTDRILNYKTM